MNKKLLTYNYIELNCLFKINDYLILKPNEKKLINFYLNLILNYDK